MHQECVMAVRLMAAKEHFFCTQAHCKQSVQECRQRKLVGTLYDGRHQCLLRKERRRGRRLVIHGLAVFRRSGTHSSSLLSSLLLSLTKYSARCSSRTCTRFFCDSAKPSGFARYSCASVLNRRLLR